MGKPKKGKKGQDDDFGDDEVEIETPVSTQEDDMESQAANKAAKKGKKGKKARKDEDLEDIEREIAAMALEANGGEIAEQEDEVVPAPKKKEKKKKKKGQGDDDVEEDEGQQSKSRFDMLLMDDDDDGGAGEKDSEDEENKPKNGIVLESVGDQESQNKPKKDKKKNKKSKAKTAEEEDVDAILAALDEPTEKKKGKKKKKGGGEEGEGEEDTKGDEPVQEVEKQEPRVVTIDDYESDEDSKKKKKKKNKKEEKEAEGEEGGAEGEDEEGGTVKTAAQKKKEKKERERLKKLQKNQQQKKEETNKIPAPSVEGEQTEASREATPALPEAENEGEAAAEGEGEKEGKKKKKKKGEKEKEEKKPKNAAMLAKIKEAQAKLREEEEARRREEEEAERREEERIRKLEEQKRLEEERRLKKKMKKKEREERLKKEGKFLTEKQKQDRMRLNQMLDNIKEQGGIVPNRDEVPKKRPVYGKKKTQKDAQQKGDESEKSPSPEDERASELSSDQTENQEVQAPEVEQKEEEVVEVKEAWDDESEEEQEEDDEEEEEIKAKALSKQESKESDEEDDEEESDDDEDESSEEEESSEESSSEDERPPAERGRDKVLKRQAAAEEKKTTDVLRAPVVCVLGHVDTGKTKILDKLRRTNVQDGEAGGITQQIGATNVPRDAVLEKTKMCKEFTKAELKLPGLLIIDTPGHESFSNLRSRGSSLCDIAILVVDIMHGLEPQTIESINLLKSRKTPFVVALNKIDRLYGWKSYPQNDVINTIKAQAQHTKSEFEERSTQVITQLAEEGLNAKLFYENKNPKEYVSLIPTSAHSGDGMGNLVALICELTQTLLAKRLAYSEELQATVMEVKALHGMGTTIDVILVNGKVSEGQTMVLAGTEGPIVTPIRGLLMPQPMRELRVKTNAYQHQKEVLAAQGVKIIAKDLEKALAGLPLYIAHDKDEIEYFRQEAERGLEDALKAIKLSDRGVFVQASTLGSLEALLEYLRTEKVKYAGINIGPVHKKDIMKASIMLEHDPQYAVILAFDVEVKRDIQEFADSTGVTIFTADIIYHLFDKFTQYRDDLLKKKQEEFKHVAVFPCKLKIMPQYIFNSRDPIVMGVIVHSGFLKEGTPICVPSKEFVDIGRVASIEFNHKPVEIARQGQEVCIKILPIPGEAPKMFGRHFEADDMLVSKISRESIDAVKDYFRKDMTKSDWMLIMELKKLFQIL